jgi:hypothetical protein
MKGKMLVHEFPALPESVTDNVGREVRPGDHIVYAVRDGNTAEMSHAVIENFQWPKTATYGDRQPILKIKLLTGQDRFGEPTYSLIEERHKRFAKIEPLS